MKSEDQFWILFWAMLCSTLVIILMIGKAIDGQQRRHREAMAERGYEYVPEMLAGRSTPVWSWKKVEDMPLMRDPNDPSEIIRAEEAVGDPFRGLTSEELDEINEPYEVRVGNGD